MATPNPAQRDQPLAQGPEPSQLIPGFEERQILRNPEKTAQLRWDMPLGAFRHLALDNTKRIVASKQNFPWSIARGDFHSHTQHSDGIGTIRETADMAKAAGLDFQFVTDHWGLTQAPECREHGMWVGQEPGTALHHLGIVGLDEAFAPKQDFLADYASALEKGATVFVPHPTGWWPAMVYTEEQKKVLEELPSPFLMEICNGGGNIGSAFDYTDETAIALWDHLLCLGRVVHAMGNTDAHMPHGIGIVWNGVFAEKCDQATIIAEVKKGHSFVSDAPLIHLALGDARMGDHANAEDRAQELEVSVSDSRGLSSVAVIADGEEIFYRHLRHTTAWNEKISLPGSLKKYMRVECFSRDGRRAYSNPIYLA